MPWNRGRSMNSVSERSTHNNYCVRFFLTINTSKLYFFYCVIDIGRTVKCSRPAVSLGIIQLGNNRPAGHPPHGAGGLCPKLYGANTLTVKCGAVKCTMAELTIKQERARLPLRFSSFYELYKKFLKEHGCKWHDVSKLLSVVAEILFDVDGACSRIAGKVSPV